VRAVAGAHRQSALAEAAGRRRPWQRLWAHPQPDHNDKGVGDLLLPLEPEKLDVARQLLRQDLVELKVAHRGAAMCGGGGSGGGGGRAAQRRHIYGGIVVLRIYIVFSTLRGRVLSL
jgi:hypothetical protein